MRIVSLLFIMSCFLVQCSGKEREKPDNLPEGANWVGGVDGGVWVKINEKITDDKFDITIWFESGNLRNSGIHVLKCNCKEKEYTINDIYDMANFYTAKTLRLRKKSGDNYCYLELIDS